MCSTGVLQDCSVFLLVTGETHGLETSERGLQSRQSLGMDLQPYICPGSHRPPAALVCVCWCVCTCVCRLSSTGIHSLYLGRSLTLAQCVRDDGNVRMCVCLLPVDILNNVKVSSVLVFQQLKKSLNSNYCGDHSCKVWLNDPTYK